MTSSCVYGAVNMNVYSYGIKLQEAGVLGNLTDMLTETAYIKLAWLLSNKENLNQYERNMHGEISEKLNQ